MTKFIAAGFELAANPDFKAVPEFKAPGNYKDPDKIAAYVTEASAKWHADASQYIYSGFAQKIVVANCVPGGGAHTLQSQVPGEAADLANRKLVELCAEDAAPWSQGQCGVYRIAAFNAPRLLQELQLGSRTYKGAAPLLPVFGGYRVDSEGYGLLFDVETLLQPGGTGRCELLPLLKQLHIEPPKGWTAPGRRAEDDALLIGRILIRFGLVAGKG